MNKNKKNRKGFTIVELVIVIAVIGILATVLVPTFGDIIDKANGSKALQQAKSVYTQAYADALANDGVIGTGDTLSGTGWTLTEAGVFTYTGVTGFTVTFDGTSTWTTTQAQG